MKVGMSMLREAMIALVAAASIGMMAPDAASAGGGHGGIGGGHAGFGGLHSGYGYRGFHHYGPGFAFGTALGLGLFAPYYYGGYPYYDYPVVGYEGYDSACYLARHRVHTRHGWRYRTVEICE